ncbi:MAG: energy transducer TonB [Opitutaceae bacterium]
MSERTDRRSPAYVSSLLLHGGAAALIALAGFLAEQSASPPARIFELVQGPGDNYRATEAPKLGEPTGRARIKLTIPQMAMDRPEAPAAVPAEPIETEPPVPVTPVEVRPKPVRRMAPAHSESVPNFKRELARTESRRISHLRWEERVRDLRRRRAEAAARRAKELARRRAAAAQHVSYAEYLKEHGLSAEPAPRGLRGGVTRGTGSVAGAGGTALTRAQMDELDAYFAELRIQLQNNFAAPPEANDAMVAHVSFHMGADGSISGVRITHSSGDEAFDEAVIEAFHRVRMGPRPDGRGEDDELDFSLKEDVDSGP